MKNPFILGIVEESDFCATRFLIMVVYRGNIQP